MMTAVETILNQYVLPIGLAFLIAWLVQRSSHWIVGRFVTLTEFAPESIRLREQRRRTFHDLFASIIGFTAFLIAGIFALGRFMDATTLIWMIGLFSAAFGLGARPLISDFLTGISFVFEDPFDVGEKIEILEVEGVIEKINLRTIHVRAPGGELYVIPNGEIRVIRNFSRGIYSLANITLKVPSSDLEKTLSVLENLSDEAMRTLPNLLEPWQVISEKGAVGKHAELTLLVKARFGKAAELRPRLLALVRQHLTDAEIELVD